jgi:hypothetical protein
MSEKAPFAQKILVLRKTLDGSVMLGWLTEDGQANEATPPYHFWGGIAAKLNRAFGYPESNGILYAFVVSCCVIPLLWFTPRRRIITFTLVYLLVTWCQMVVVPNTGATLHHVILLWPFPHVLIAIVAAETAQRLGKKGSRLVTALLFILVARNLMLINRYYVDLITRGTSVIWTDAVIPLHNYIESLDRPHVVTVDWGYATTLCLLSDGDIHIDDISYTLLSPSERERVWIRGLMDDPQSLFVDHMDNGGQFRTAREQLASIATEGNRQKDIRQVILDRNLRPRFQIFRYVPVP